MFLKLEKQVCSLELAKRLKELGVEQEALFSWAPGQMDYGYEGEWNIVPDDGRFFVFSEEVGYQLTGINFRPDVDQSTDDWYDALEAEREKLAEQVCMAFTAAELGQMLPLRIKLPDAEFPSYSFQTHRQPDGSWWVSYGAEEIVEIENTEADARAKMLVYLLENGLLKARSSKTRNSAKAA